MITLTFDVKTTDSELYELYLVSGIDWPETVRENWKRC